MNERVIRVQSRLLPVAVLLVVLAIWEFFSLRHLVPESTFPSPHGVWTGFQEEIGAGRLLEDIIASLFRISVGFLLAVVLSVPFGLWLGSHIQASMALLPATNFFRSLSPLAWIPFAILWFGIGDAPAIFLIFLSTFFPLALAVTAAVANIPSVYFQVGRDYGFRGTKLLLGVTLPAIAPQLITALRVTAGVAWMVVVAAEMIAGHDGLGFAIWDARNGLRTDLLVCNMIVIGCIGMALDRLLVLLTTLP
ncbi:MAG: ABC transporter permease, partial [Armatimonadota bacterium]|nr:ABC transporter permease [Armatimonadota bacterium]